VDCEGGQKVHGLDAK